MANRSSLTSVYTSMQKSPNFNDEEHTVDFNTHDIDELPPMPTPGPSGRSFDLLGSLSDFGQKDAFRALHGPPDPPVSSDQSIQIAASNASVNDEGDLFPSVAESYRPQPSSGSVVIEIAASETSLQELSHQRSAMSLGSRQSQPVDGEEESSHESATTSTPLTSSALSRPGILWKSHEPLLVLRDITLLHGERVLVRDVNLDISHTGGDNIIC